MLKMINHYLPDIVVWTVAMAALALAVWALGRVRNHILKPAPVPGAAGALVPPDLIEPFPPRIKDLPVGGVAYTFFGCHLATDRSIWIDPEDFQEESPGPGKTSRVRVTRQADGYHVHILGTVKGAGRGTPGQLAAFGYVRAVEVTH